MVKGKPWCEGILKKRADYMPVLVIVQKNIFAVILDLLFINNIYGIYIEVLKAIVLYSNVVFCV